MYEYQINVSHNGYFLFRTDKETSRTQAYLTFDLLVESLPKNSGYVVTLSEWTAPTGQDLGTVTV